MKTFESFALSTIATLILLSILFGFGFFMSFMYDIEVKSNIENPEFNLFMVRLLIGVMFLGVMKGALSIWDFFIFSFKTCQKFDKKRIKSLGE